jgi:hypothetical protein
MENAIIDRYRRDGSKNKPTSINDSRRGIHLQRMPGGLGSFSLAWRNVVSTRGLKERG